MTQGSKIREYKGLMCWKSMRVFLLNFLLFAIGFTIGRLSHIINAMSPAINNSMLPHHWIVGIIGIVLSYSYRNNYLFYFSLGLFISDLNDFIHFKTFEPDITTDIKFFGVD